MANMFDENGNYNKTEWKPGDRITAGKLNKIEESLEAINNNDIERHKEADERLDALEEQNEAVEERFDELEDLVADNKSEVEVLIHENNVKMDRLEQEMNDGIDTVEAIAHVVDDKIAEADASMKAQVNQGKADMEAMVAEVEGDLSIIQQSRYILNTHDSTFDSEFQKALDICKNTGQEIFIPPGVYTSSSTFNIEYSASIVMDKSALINISQTFLNINYPYCNIELNGTIQLISECTAICVNNPTVLADKCIIGGKYTINLKSGEYLENSVGFHVNSAYWDNTLNICTKNIGTPILLGGSWSNANNFFGRLIGYKKAIDINIKSMCQANLFKLQVEQVINNETYGVFINQSSAIIKANNFILDHWLDCATGKYWCYYDEHYASDDTVYRFIDNTIEGELEGLLKINVDLNIMKTLFFTKRDRSVIANDTIGVYNRSIFTNHHPRNIIKTDISKYTSIYNIDLQIVNKDNIKGSVVYDEEVGENVICIEYLNDGKSGFLTKMVSSDDSTLAGKTYTLSADIKMPSTNVQRGYFLALQDGINVAYSDTTVYADDTWTRVYVTFKVTNNANMLQINLGRALSPETYTSGDKIYIKNIMLNMGHYRNMHYTPCYEENFITCTELPPPSKNLKGKVMILNDIELYICLLFNDAWTWKRISIE